MLLRIHAAVSDWLSTSPKTKRNLMVAFKKVVPYYTQHKGCI